MENVPNKRKFIVYSKIIVKEVKKYIQKLYRPYCSVFKSHFQNQKILYCHLKNIHNQNPFICIRCNQSYEFIKELKDHIKIAHLRIDRQFEFQYKRINLILKQQQTQIQKEHKKRNMQEKKNQQSSKNEEVLKKLRKGSQTVQNVDLHQNRGSLREYFFQPSQQQENSGININSRQFLSKIEDDKDSELLENNNDTYIINTNLESQFTDQLSADNFKIYSWDINQCYQDTTVHIQENNTMEFYLKIYGNQFSL